MPQQNYEYVDFLQYNGETDKMERVCRVYLTKGKLHYEGPDAKKCKELVDSSDVLAPFRKEGGYTLLAELCNAFNGGYFHATDVKQPYDDAEADDAPESEPK